MNARQLQHKTSRTSRTPLEASNFKPSHLTTKALNEDSCWDEFDAEYEDVISGDELSFLDDISCN